jgi:hypothetical protein
MILLGSIGIDGGKLFRTNMRLATEAFSGFIMAEPQFNQRITL